MEMRPALFPGRALERRQLTRRYWRCLAKYGPRIVDVDTLKDTNAGGRIIAGGWRCCTTVDNFFFHIVEIICCWEYWCRWRFLLTQQRVDGLPYTTRVVANSQQLMALACDCPLEDFNAALNTSRDAVLLFVLDRCSIQHTEFLVDRDSVSNQGRSLRSRIANYVIRAGSSSSSATMVDEFVKGRCHVEFPHHSYTKQNPLTKHLEIENFRWPS